MRAAIFCAIWASLALPLLASAIARRPGTAVSKIVPPARRGLFDGDLFGEVEDHTEDLNWSEINTAIGDLTNFPDFNVDCNECRLSGSIQTSLKDSELRITFTETSALVNISLAIGAGDEQIIPIWNIGGINFGKGLGLGLFLELVISLDGELEATGGFQFTIPAGSGVSASLDGDIVNPNFDAVDGDLLPWDVTRGSGTLKVSLRLRTELGLNSKVVDLPANTAVGLYLNLVEYVVVFDNEEDDPACPLEATESWNINAGAYAEVNVDLDAITLGIEPTKSTTFFTVPASTLCLEYASVTGGDAATTTSALVTDDCDNGYDEPTAPTPTTLISTVSSARVNTITEEAVVTVTEVVEQYTTICPQTE
ncbi:hypothetical protein ACJ41O_001434 [Fusarium nematophilum]